MIIRKEANNSGRNLKGKQGHKAGHLRMVVIGNLEADTVKETVDDVCEKESTEVIMDDFPAHVKVSEAVDKTEARFVKPKEGHKELPWVHTAISNAKAVLTDMYHGIKVSIRCAVYFLEVFENIWGKFGGIDKSCYF